MSPTSSLSLGEDNARCITQPLRFLEDGDVLFEQRPRLRDHVFRVPTNRHRAGYDVLETNIAEVDDGVPAPVQQTRKPLRSEVPDRERPATAGALRNWMIPTRPEQQRVRPVSTSGPPWPTLKYAPIKYAPTASPRPRVDGGGLNGRSGGHRWVEASDGVFLPRS